MNKPLPGKAARVIRPQASTSLEAYPSLCSLLPSLLIVFWLQSFDSQPGFSVGHHSETGASLLSPQGRVRLRSPLQILVPFCLPCPQDCICSVDTVVLSGVPHSGSANMPLSGEGRSPCRIELQLCQPALKSFFLQHFFQCSLLSPLFLPCCGSLRPHL